MRSFPRRPLDAIFAVLGLQSWTQKSVSCHVLTAANSPESVLSLGSGRAEAALPVLSTRSAQLSISFFTPAILAERELHLPRSDELSLSCSLDEVEMKQKHQN